MSGTVGHDRNEETAGDVKPAHKSNATQPDSKAPSKPKTALSARKSAIDFTDRALQFFANASNETLGACLVGLVASTYLLLGRVGLLLIGVASGIVLHATWEGGTRSTSGNGEISSEERRKRETGLEVANRVLKWRSKKHSDEQRSGTHDPALELKLAIGKNIDYSDFRPETAKALHEFTDAVIRDYVKWWYSPIIPGEESFPDECRRTLAAFVISVSSHLSRKRPADTFLDFVANASSIMIVFLNELSNVVQASSAPVEEAIDLYLQMKPDSHLASMLDRKQQEMKLGMMAEDILQSFLESKTYNCRPAHLFLQEILASTILDKTIQTCSSPDWINGWIVYLLEESEPEIMNAIDAGVDHSAEAKLVSAVAKAEAAESEARSPRQQSFSSHRRTVSKAQEAMDEAMREAQRLTQMIAEEDARKLREQQQQLQQRQQAQASAASSSDDNTSESVTQSVHTPTSSQSDVGEPESQDSGIVKLAPRKARRDSEEPPPSTPKAPFTNFDQIVPPSQQPTALTDSPERRKIEPLTLTDARLSIFDDGMPGDTGAIRSKPATEYLIQIEPSSSQHPGWMIARKYADFETLHEVLSRISKVSDAAGFSEAHPALPGWKGHTKASLRGELERYLNDAAHFRPLAESEGFKRFLEKDAAGLRGTPSSKGGIPGLGWPTPSAFETMGKGMMDALTQAPKEVAGGGKALFGGVKGVLGGVASLGPKPKRSHSSHGSASRTASPSGSLASIASVTSVTTAAPTVAPFDGNASTNGATGSASRHARADSTVSPLPTFPTGAPSSRKSQDSLSSLSVIDTQPAPIAQMERRPSSQLDGTDGADGRSGLTSPAESRRSSVYARSRDHSRAPSSGRASLDELSPSLGGDQIVSLPPPPSEIADNYRPPPAADALEYHRRTASAAPLTTTTTGSGGSGDASSDSVLSPPTTTTTTTAAPPAAPLTPAETSTLVDLVFGALHSLYTLSSAWTLRRTLLAAARAFLLRPGNPQLESIRQLVQETALDGPASDAGVAALVRRARENALPTEAELRAWRAAGWTEAGLADPESAALRAKARRALVEKGVPQALAGVMGAAATGEALGRVFDALQHARVARGVAFGVALQAVKAVVQ